ncbi:MAG: hypothetical protein KDD11_11665 [Acidobacteria bacterium]|nr:hypothetical protein [Acidobacteriota bacterium]
MTSPPILSEPPRAASSSLSALERDSGCCRDLNWRCQLGPEIRPEALERRLVAAGYDSRCRHPALRVLRHPSGHELAWVLASGRVQIRIPLGVDVDHRPAAARRIHAALGELLSQASGPDQDPEVTTR